MKALTVFLLIAVVGCTKIEQTDPSRMVMQVPGAQPVTPPQRVVVTRIGIFNDQLAYGDYRGVYIIKDTQTGTEFIGVSGVGIAETGSHRNGKVSVSDER